MIMLCIVGIVYVIMKFKLNDKLDRQDEEAKKQEYILSQIRKEILRK